MKLLLAALMLFISVKGLRGLADKKQAKQQRHANPLFLAVPFMGGVMQALPNPTRPEIMQARNRTRKKSTLDNVNNEIISSEWSF